MCGKSGAFFKRHPPNDSLVQPSEHVVILLRASELLFHPVLAYYLFIILEVKK